MWPLAESDTSWAFICLVPNCGNAFTVAYHVARTEGTQLDLFSNEDLTHT